MLAIKITIFYKLPALQLTVNGLQLTFYENKLTNESEMPSMQRECEHTPMYEEIEEARYFGDLQLIIRWLTAYNNIAAHNSRVQN